MRTYFLLLLAALAVGFVACEKDTTVTTTTTTNTIAGALEPATISAFGVLTDETGAPVENAVVRAGSESTTTNADGLWRIDGADVAATFGYFTFESPGHLRGSRTVYAQDGSTYELDVQLLSRSQSYAVSAADGGTVRIGDSDAEVVFGAGAFARADGTPVASGEVTVIAHFLDAGEDATYVQMPGDLRGRQTDAASATDLTLLTSYGMVAVELEDAGGDEVELADGQTATLRMPVPLGAEATAPATIPLWYFDEAEGVWVEEGSAVLEGGFYVGEVSHFTFWNCDIPTEYVTLCGTIEFENAMPDQTRPDSNTTATNILMSLISTNWGRRTSYTDSDGKFCGIVPANETLTLNIYGKCGGIVHSITIDPLDDDFDLGLVVVPTGESQVVSITGSGECLGAPTTNGVARVYQAGSLLGVTELDAAGNFELEIVSCDESDLTVQVVDYTARAESDLYQFPFETIVTTGSISACTQALSDYFEFKIDGEAFFGDSVYVTLRNNGFFVTAEGIGANTSYGFYLNTVSQDFNDFPIPTGTFPFPAGTGVSDIVFYEQAAPADRRLPEPLLWQSVDLENQSITFTRGAVESGEQTAGRIGPWTHTAFDSVNNVTVDYIIEVEFSGATF